MLFDIWLIFVVTTFASVVMPGPSMLLALYHGGRYGKTRTLATALGTVSASLILGTVSAVGLGVILIASLLAFQLIKWLGAAYLIYLGLNLWRNASRPVEPFETEESRQRVSVLKMFRQAFWVSQSRPGADGSKSC